MKELLPIYTERLKIVETSIDDIDLILKMDKQDSTQKYLGGIKNKSREERLDFLSKKKNSLTVLLDNTRIGFVGLKINEDKAEISYIFDSDYTGEGYCSEVVKVLVDISFNKLNLTKLYAYTKEDNVASIKVLTKNGFIKKDSNEEFIYYELERGSL
jgi:ribosomal-protein-alanine N-acetyltransferase